MTWAYFKEAFERKFIAPDILYVRAQEYFNLRQKHMTIREFFIVLNALAWYALGITSINKEKIEIFINGLRSDIAKDVLTWDNPPKSYTEALGRA